MKAPELRPTQADGRGIAFKAIFEHFVAVCQLYQSDQMARISPEEADAGKRFERYLKENHDEIRRRVTGS